MSAPPFAPDLLSAAPALVPWPQVCWVTSILATLMGLRGTVDRFCNAPTLEEQRRIWDSNWLVKIFTKSPKAVLSVVCAFVQLVFLNKAVMWFGGGVPPKQLELITKDGVNICNYVGRTFQGAAQQTHMRTSNYFYYNCLMGRFTKASTHVPPSLPAEIQRGPSAHACRTHGNQRIARPYLSHAGVLPQLPQARQLWPAARDRGAADGGQQLLPDRAAEAQVHQDHPDGPRRLAVRAADAGAGTSPCRPGTPPLGHSLAAAWPGATHPSPPFLPYPQVVPGGIIIFRSAGYEPPYAKQLEAAGFDVTCLQRADKTPFMDRVNM